MSKLYFSGHQSFICKQFWLKKAYEYARAKRSFSEETAVIELGVGKNMVSSIQFWGKAFGILTDADVPTPLGSYLFGSRGKDKFLEDVGTTWLLHTQLIRHGRSSIYPFVFNEFRKERIDFTKEQLHQFLKRRCEEVNPSSYNLNTISNDINVFVRNYVKPPKDEKFEIEDDFAGLLIELNLVKQFKQRDEDNKIVHWYKIEAQERMDLPFQLVLYCILENFPNQKTISFRELMSRQNSPGTMFALNPEGLYQKLVQITDSYKGINYTETAGNQVLQIKSAIQPLEVLDDYYNQN